MPEEPEIDIDKLDEKIHEELEREGGSLLKAIALTTAVLTPSRSPKQTGTTGRGNFK